MEKSVIKIETDIVLADIVGYSLLSNENQLSTVEIISEFIPRTLSFWAALKNLQDEQLLLGSITTGDGFYIILNPKMRGFGVLLGLSLRNYLLWLSSEMGGLYQGARVAINAGIVLPFIDMNGSKNYVGDGLNDCSRLLALKLEETVGFCGDSNYSIASETAYRWFEQLFDDEKSMNFLSTIKFRKSDKVQIIDKHKKVHDAYLVELSRQILIQPPIPSLAPNSPSEADESSDFYIKSDDSQHG